MTKTRLAVLSTVSMALATLWCLLKILNCHSLPPSHAQGLDGYTLYYVAPGGDCSGHSPCYSNIQAAIDAADDPDDQVLIAAGQYTDVNHSAGLAQIAYISKTLTVRGGYSADFGTWDPEIYTTTLDAQGLGRSVFITGGVSAAQGQTATVTMEGLRITGGDAEGLDPYSPYWDGGGGIGVFTATVTMSNCILDNSTADYGGGALFRDSTVTMTECIVEDNTANTSGGGLHCYHSSIALTGNLIQDNRVIDTNTVGQGGGLYFFACNVTLTDNRITGNIANTTSRGGYGGGLSINDSTAVLRDNSIESNIGGLVAGCGGGIYGRGWWEDENNITLIGNTIANNTASAGDGHSGIGGGLCLWYSTAYLRDNLVVSNTASMTGEGEGGGMLATDCTVTLDNNTIQSNTASTSEMGTGGGIRIDYSTATLSRNLIRDNVASETGWGVGGGMFFNYGLITLDGNTFISNTATLSPTALGEGGGLAILGNPSFTVTNNLFAGNHASTSGSGIWCYGSASRRTAGKLIHTTIADSRGPGGGHICRRVFHARAHQYDRCRQRQCGHYRDRERHGDAGSNALGKRRLEQRE